MVIITIIVCKIYFPEALERGTSPVMTRSYSYRIAEEEDYYGSDVSDDDGDNSECLDSDGSDTDNDPNVLVSPNSTKFQNFMEFDQERMTKSQVLKRLLFCCIVLNITFVAWGVLQERMLTRRYPRVTGEYFTYSYFLVFTNRFWTLIMSGILLLYLKPRRSQSTIIYEYSFPSISNMLSSWCQYEALRYVSFPATTLFKAFKLAPVMMMGKILGNKSCTYRNKTKCYVYRFTVYYTHYFSWILFFYRSTI